MFPLEALPTLHPNEAEFVAGPAVPQSSSGSGYSFAPRSAARALAVLLLMAGSALAADSSPQQTTERLPGTASSPQQTKERSPGNTNPTLRLPLPKRSQATPVQKLNQQGVQALEKRDIAKAKKYFYQAYLIDPNDPFTLNNLGYVAELEGELERAQRYYALAVEHPSGAVVTHATDPSMIGKSVDKVAGSAPDRKIEVNRLNVYAINLLTKERVPEADSILQKALAMDARNPFTLNNLGFAREKQGELEQAFDFYSRSAALGSHEPIVVTMFKNWRGREISAVAAENARKVEREMKKERNAEAQVALLNLRGVSAENRNERKLAQQYFREAYKLDPQNAFVLNNMGYLSELDGDRETASFFYEKAVEARRAKATIAVATRPDAQGQSLSSTANTSDQAMDAAQRVAQELRRQKGAAPSLLNRDNQPVVEPAQPPPPMEPTAMAAPPAQQPSGAVENGPAMDVLEPLPDNEQPDAAKPENGPVQGVIPPLPESAQPK